MAFEDKIFYNYENNLSFEEKEIEVLKEIHDVHIITDEEQEIEVPQQLVPKAKLEEKKYTYMAYGGLISASVLIAFFVLMKYTYMANGNVALQTNESKKKRN